MAENPYERRGQGSLGADVASARLTLADGGWPRALAIEDLDALVGSAHSRGRLAAERELGALRVEEVGKAHRLAWDEGHGAGLVAGQARLLARIDERFGERVLGLLDAFRERLAGENAEDLLSMRSSVEEARSLLAELVEAHHDGFPPPDPF